MFWINWILLLLLLSLTDWLIDWLIDLLIDGWMDLICWLWEEAEVPGKNQYRRGRTSKIHTEGRWVVLKAMTFLQWGYSANTTLPCCKVEECGEIFFCDSGACKSVILTSKDNKIKQDSNFSNQTIEEWWHQWITPLQTYDWYCYYLIQCNYPGLMEQILPTEACVHGSIRV